MEHPLVSVVAITRNHEEFCVEALDSIINQSYKNLELIILDAASTDRTLQIIDEWLSEKNLQALFLKEKELKPLPVNLNKALTFATGEYVQFISLDDVLLENKFNDQVELLLKNPDCVFSYSDCYLIDENNNCSIKTRLEFKKIESPPTGDVFQELLNLGYFTATPTILWNRLKLQEIGRFNEKYLMEDLEFIYRATLKFKVVYCDKITLKYRVLSSSLSHTPNARFLMEECEIKLKYLTFSKMPQQTVEYKNIFNNMLRIYKLNNFEYHQIYFSSLVRFPSFNSFLLYFFYRLRINYSLYQRVISRINKISSN